jgi:hypothetical protein
LVSLLAMGALLAWHYQRRPRAKVGVEAERRLG